MPNLVNGLGGAAGFGEGILGRNDDSSTGAINITSIFGPSGLNFFGTLYTSVYVNNNGNLTFGGPTGQYTPQPIGANLSIPIIAALWTDIDTRVIPNVTTQTSMGGTSTGTNLVYYDVDSATRTFTATWDDVDFYNTQIGHPAAFQIQLIDVGGGNFDIAFIYENVVVDGANYVNTSRAGYSPGQGRPGGFEIGLSGTSQMADIDTIPGNTGQSGYYYFQVRGGQVFGGAGGPDPDTIPIERQHTTNFDIQTPGLAREGDTGATPFDFVIVRSGDLDGGAVVAYEIHVDDPNDLVPGQVLSGEASFEPYQTRFVIPVSIQGDRLFEQEDIVTVRLTSASYGGDTWDPGGLATAIIVNDDPSTTYAFSGPVSGAEGPAGPMPFEFIAVRTGDLTASATVQWRLEPNSADALDLSPGQPLSGVATFARGESEAVIRIMVAGDLRPEMDETFTVRLTSATTRSATTEINVSTVGTILDDDVRQSLIVASPTALVRPEGDDGATAFNFVLTRVGDLDTALAMPFAVGFPAAGGASASEILSALSGTVSFAPGASETVFTVLVQGDSTPEDSEIFQVTVGGGDLNILVLSGVIMNDDKMPATASITDTAANQGAGAPLDDMSSFMQHLAGGDFWSEGNLF